MTQFLFANNAATTLAGPISSSSTSINLAAGTGALFPSPGTGQQFAITLVSQTDSAQIEIVYCTARASDTCIVIRGQENTTPTAFIAGDFASNNLTAGTTAVLTQAAQLQQQSTNYGNDTGTVNSYTVTLTPAPASLASIIGTPIRVKIANTNTGASVLTVNPLPTTTIIGIDGAALISGTLLAGQVAEFIYDGTNFEYGGVRAVGGDLTGSLPNPTLAANAAVNSLGFTPVQQGGGTGQTSTKLYIGWDGSFARIQAGSTDIGEIGTLPVAQTWTATQTFSAGVVASGQDANGANFRAVGGTGSAAVGGVLHNDGTKFYILLTPIGTPLGSWTSARPFTINTTTAAVAIDQTGAGLTLGAAGSATAIEGALTVADTLAVTGAMTAPTPAVGDNSSNVATTAFLQDSTIGGPAQSWQNVTSSRAFNTVYTNSTGRPIFVSATAYSNSAALALGYQVNGIGPGQAFSVGVTSAMYGTVAFIVPAGGTYEVTCSYTNALWCELR